MTPFSVLSVYLCLSLSLSLCLCLWLSLSLSLSVSDSGSLCLWLSLSLSLCLSLSLSLTVCFSKLLLLQGLGEAFLTHNGREYWVHPGEGGHSDFAPRTQEEFDLMQFIIRSKE